MLSTPPPVIVGEIVSRRGELTQATATRHVRNITESVRAVEAAVEQLPEGPDKTNIKELLLRHHNFLGRGGKSLNRHFQTAQVSPDSEGGDKGGSTSEVAQA